MSAQDVIADQIEGLVIGSGWDVAPTRKQSESIAAQTVRALEGSGYAVVKLPEVEPGEEDDIATGWDTPRESVNIWHSHPTEIELHEMANEPLSATEARELAAALLAAARHAEAGGDRG